MKTTTLKDLKHGQHFKDTQGRTCVFLGRSPKKDEEWGAYYLNRKGVWIVAQNTLDMKVQKIAGDAQECGHITK